MSCSYSSILVIDCVAFSCQSTHHTLSSGFSHFGTVWKYKPDFSHFFLFLFVDALDLLGPNVALMNTTYNVDIRCFLMCLKLTVFQLNVKIKQWQHKKINERPPDDVVLLSKQICSCFCCWLLAGKCFWFDSACVFMKEVPGFILVARYICLLKSILLTFFFLKQGQKCSGRCVSVKRVQNQI